MYSMSVKVLFVVSAHAQIPPWPERDQKWRDTHLNRMWLFWYRISVIFFLLTFEIGVAEKESSAGEEMYERMVI